MGSSKQTSLLYTMRNQGTLLGLEENSDVSSDEKIVLDKVAEALARLGRVKRVGLSATDKEAFVKAWTRQRRR